MRAKGGKVRPGSHRAKTRAVTGASRTVPGVLPGLGCAAILWNCHGCRSDHVRPVGGQAACPLEGRGGTMTVLRPPGQTGLRPRMQTSHPWFQTSLADSRVCPPKEQTVSPPSGTPTGLNSKAQGNALGRRNPCLPTLKGLYNSWHRCRQARSIQPLQGWGWGHASTQGVALGFGIQPRWGSGAQDGPPSFCSCPPVFLRSGLERLATPRWGL